MSKKAAQTAVADWVYDNRWTLLSLPLKGAARRIHGPNSEVYAEALLKPAKEIESKTKRFLQKHKNDPNVKLLLKAYKHGR